MKTLTASIALFMLLPIMATNLNDVCLGQAKPEPETGPYGIQISLLKDRYAFLEPISLRLITTSRGASVSAPVGNPIVIFALHLTSTNHGTAVPLTLYARFLKDPMNYHGTQALTLGPGLRLDDEMLLNRAVDLSMGGDYDLYVTRQLPDPSNDRKFVTVQSNTIHFWIDPRSKPNGDAAASPASRPATRPAQSR